MTTKRILITQPRGPVAQSCIARLAARGFEVHAIADDFIEHAEEAVREPSLTWHACDLDNHFQATELFAQLKPTHLLYTGLSSRTLAMESIRFDADRAIRDLRNARLIGRAFMRSGGQRIIGVGSYHEYASGGVLYDEQSPLKSDTGLNRSQIALMHQFAEIAGVEAEFTWCRMFEHFGPTPDNFAGDAIRRVIAGRAIDLNGDGAIFDQLYADDAGDALAAVADSKLCGPVNIGSGVAVRNELLLGHIVSIFKEQHLKTPLSFRRQRRMTFPLPKIANVSRLLNEIGWRPRYTHRQAIAEAIEIVCRESNYTLCGRAA